MSYVPFNQIVTMTTEVIQGSILPILAIGAGLALVGWGAFKIISKIHDIKLRQNAKPAPKE